MKREIDCLDAFNEAVAHLKRAGFVLDHVAANGNTTCYYRYPGRTGFIRVSTHKGSKGPIGIGGVVAKLTYSAKCIHSAPGKLRLSPEALRNGVVMAVGRYFVGEPMQARYDGPKATPLRANATSPAADCRTSAATDPRESAAPPPPISPMIPWGWLARMLASESASRTSHTAPVCTGEEQDEWPG